MSLDSENVFALIVLANCLLIQGDIPEAEHALRKYGRKIPKHAEFLYHLDVAAVRLATGRFQEAIGAYQLARRARPDHTATDSALRWLYEAAKKDPRFLLGAAMVNDYWQDEQLAIADYRESLAQCALPDPVAQFVRSRIGTLEKRLAGSATNACGQTPATRRTQKPKARQGGSRRRSAQRKQPK